MSEAILACLLREWSHRLDREIDRILDILPRIEIEPSPVATALAQMVGSKPNTTVVCDDLEELIAIRDAIDHLQGMLEQQA